MTSNQFLSQEEKEYLNRIDELKKENKEQQKEIERLKVECQRLEDFNKQIWMVKSEKEGQVEKLKAALLWDRTKLQCSREDALVSLQEEMPDIFRHLINPYFSIIDWHIEKEGTDFSITGTIIDDSTGQSANFNFFNKNSRFLDIQLILKERYENF